MRQSNHRGVLAKESRRRHAKDVSGSACSILVEIQTIDPRQANLFTTGGVGIAGEQAARNRHGNWKGGYETFRNRRASEELEPGLEPVSDRDDDLLKRLCRYGFRVYIFLSLPLVHPHLVTTAPPHTLTEPKYKHLPLTIPTILHIPTYLTIYTQAKNVSPQHKHTSRIPSLVQDLKPVPARPVSRHRPQRERQAAHGPGGRQKLDAAVGGAL